MTSRAILPLLALGLLLGGVTVLSLNLASALPLLPILANKEEKPAQLDTTAILNFDTLSKERQELLAFALATGHRHGWLKYRFGSADPANGGFDCSGSIYYILRSLGYMPPRTSAQQYRWLVDTERFISTASATSLSDDVFSRLHPGDLLFWSGTYEPTDGRKDPITHVQMYLGTEIESGTHLMIGASNGRTYHGKKQNGYGVFTFNLPRPESTSKFVGYGTPPGVD